MVLNKIFNSPYASSTVIGSSYIGYDLCDLSALAAFATFVAITFYFGAFTVFD